MKIFITEDQIKKIINESETELSELRKSYLSYIQNKAKEVTGQEWPDYVLRDWLYTSSKDDEFGLNSRPQTFIEDQLKAFLREYGKGHWEYKKVKINMDVFTLQSKDFIELRMNSIGQNPYGIKKDTERFNTQKQLLNKKKNVSEEPIILIQVNGRYELFEGWHRTITYLSEYKEYEQNAYIYIPN